jgi:FkbM family methyltransferase
VLNVRKCIRRFRLRSLLKRIYQYRNRRRAAAALGFSFRRSRDFEPPSRICVLGAEQELHLPPDHGTRVAFLDILLDDCYGLRDFPDGVVSVLDIGAHAGLFSLAASMRFPRAEIHAYEPNPEMLPFLRQQSQVGNFSVFPEAVDVRANQVRIVGNGDSVHAKVVPDPESNIKCTSFADAIARLLKTPILVKLDCEGAEWEILRDTVAWRDIRFLTMEYHLWAGYTLVELRQRIESLGFVIKSLADTGEEFGILTAQRF